MWTVEQLQSLHYCASLASGRTYELHSTKPVLFHLLLTIRLKDQSMKNLFAFMIQFMIKLLPGLLLLKTIWRCKFSIILGPCQEKNQSLLKHFDGKNATCSIFVSTGPSYVKDSQTILVVCQRLPVREAFCLKQRYTFNNSLPDPWIYNR